MLDKLIAFSLRQRLLIIIAVVMLIGLGFYSFKKLPIDAFPDVTNIQVQVIAEAPGRSPIEVEKLVTFPIEVQMTGLPKLVELRSLSKFGLSMVTVVFEDTVDIYFARQLVLERLIEAKENLPEGVKTALGPISTGLGEIYQYTLERPPEAVVKDKTEDLTELRTMQDWIVRPILKTISGVADVNSFGGYVKQYQVIIDPEKLAKYDLTVREVFEAIADNNSNAGGNIIEHSAEQYLVRGIGLIQSIDDIKDIIIKEKEEVPVYVSNIAEVKIGPETRQGALVVDGKGEGVAGIVMMLKGESGKEVVERVKNKVQEINDGKVLPAGIKIKPFYDRTELVEKCLATVEKALTEGAIFVIIILYLFLRNFRAAFVVALTLPLAVLATFIVMKMIGLSANLMTLGGLAISLGMVVDAAIIQVENVQRHLSESGASKHKFTTILNAVMEVRKPSILGELIIAITFLPIMTLQGMEGKMFSPLAFTIAIALFSSLALSIFVIPVFCSFFLKAGNEKESFLILWAKKLYLPVLKNALKHRITVIISALMMFGGSLALIPFLGTEFIPALDEGSLTPQIIRLPSISLRESVEIEAIAQKIIMRFPEVETVVSKIGTAEIATDPMGPNISDPIVILKPRKYWKTAKTKEELAEKMREALSRIPGIGLNVTQPIALKVDELISGVKSQIAIKLFGDDMDILKAKGDEIAKIISGVKGVEDLRVEQVSGQSYVEVKIDRRKIARYGINVSDIQEIIETAIGGKSPTEVFEGEKRFSVLVRFPEDKRDSIKAIENILVNSSKGFKIPLAQLAAVNLVEGPVQISRENSKRRIVVECNVKGRDIGSFVAESQAKLKERLKLPAGYYLTWGGAFENQQRAMKQLGIIVPVTILLIFFLLFSSFNSLKQAFLVIINLPFALIGGIVALFISGLYLSVPASVGFIALFGVAVLNGVVLVSCINQLRKEGMPVNKAIVKGCEQRLRPILMTASVAVFGLVPMLFASGPGSEVQKPLAVVVVGGLITSTLITLLVLPVLYGWFEKEDVEF
ncbi:MAG: CusA/CzcA family heavy metal efflux RND transporter [Candidatus Omnitrophota bacterium]|nr:CusA/CzcA family heavy metal efflux RND transporter [Candidatus Omnitrophota bacterium]